MFFQEATGSSSQNGDLADGGVPNVTEELKSPESEKRISVDDLILHYRETRKNQGSGADMVRVNANRGDVLVAKSLLLDRLTRSFKSMLDDQADPDANKFMRSGLGHDQESTTAFFRRINNDQTINDANRKVFERAFEQLWDEVSKPPVQTVLAFSTDVHLGRGSV